MGWGKHLLGGGDTAHAMLMGGIIEVGTLHIIERKSLAVGGSLENYGTILQAKIFQIISLTENPRWSRVWILKEI